jgi:1-deoxy-D-xylulose-5-phosphate reductoisomerase
MKKRVIVLGATGSIGRQAIEAVSAFPERYEIVGLSAHRDAARLLAAAEGFPRARLALSSTQAGRAGTVDSRIGFLGPGGLIDLLRGTEADIVVNGIAGAAGLAPSIACLESGKDLALANKESVVMGYALLEAAAARSGKAILPVDSEHAAVFQLMRRISDPEEIYITASGGAFRDRPLVELAAVRPDEAAAHPSWSMGRKISIDSATMANKGLEVIEASRLFHLPPAKVKVLIHPQSIVHALLRDRDGALYANMSAPDMRLPILNALAYPESLPSPFGHLDLAAHRLDFRAPEAERYPALGLAYEALAAGYGASVAYNAADEVAVAAFEAGKIGFLDIARVIESSLARNWPRELPNLPSIFEADREARQLALTFCKEQG